MVTLGALLKQKNYRSVLQVQSKKILTACIAMRFYIHSSRYLMSRLRISNIERTLKKKKKFRKNAKMLIRNTDLNSKKMACLKEEMVLLT